MLVLALLHMCIGCTYSERGCLLSKVAVNPMPWKHTQGLYLQIATMNSTAASTVHPWVQALILVLEVHGTYSNP